MSEIKIFSFFSGSGFLDLGFEKSGYKVEFVNEFFEPFLSAYKYSREKMHLDKPKYGYWNTNINEYLQERKKELKGYMFDAISDGSLVGFIGGPPCPDFSVGGKNKGRNGDNGKLSLSYVNLITEMQPDFFLFENVKGLWRTKRHRQFYEELKKQLHNHGYCTTERLTNSLEFGVPQDRDRILLVGIKSSLLHDNKEKENNIIDFPWLNYVKYDLEKVKKLSWPKKTPFMENSEQKRPLEIINELTVEHWFEVNDVLNHPNSSKYFIPRNGIVKMRTVEEGDVSKKCFKRLHRWRYSPTAAYGNNEVHLHPYKCRRLSVAEALAIQSLPRDFSLPNDMTLSNMFKTIGNGVPFLLSVGIARSIKDYLSNTGNRREYKMERVTGYNLISYINQLPKNITYNYVNPSTKGLIKILSANLPNGPIVFKRWDPSKGGNVEGAKIETISSEMVWRLANAFVAGQPVNVDRIFGGSYNTRSVLESLVAHTPQFYYCYPGRIMDIAGRSSVERGHKHLVWSPLNPHENGKLEKINTDVVISEIPVTSAVYDALYIPDTLDNNGMDIDVRRRHTQIQIALYLIGLQLGYRTWIAQNDKGIKYNNKPLIEQQGVVTSLNNENLVGPYDGAVNAGAFIDCIWFKNGRLMPAVMEVEHTTGVTSGLERMYNFYNRIPAIKTRYVIAAPDEDRELVVREANKTMFKELDTRYFPYSSVEELYNLCQRRKLKGITEEFLDCFMEPVVFR